MSLPSRFLQAPAACAFLGLLGVLSAPPPAYSQALPELNIDLRETTVSGISSGAFMAVQLGVARSASVKGVAATAGGPYFCALQDSLGGLQTSRAMRRCMQGDPAIGVTPIGSDELAQMEAAARAWASRGEIDPLAGLATQTVWLFHGYNDGIVKKPVNDALTAWYGRFTPASQIFIKDDLNAGHAQITASCGEGTGGSCNPCPQTGGSFLNTCADKPAEGRPYDAAGAALQLFYGPLQRTPTAQLASQLEAFAQRPFTRDRRDGAVAPQRIAMGDTGYVYVPQACKAGEPCRLHIAFHGCKQDAGSIRKAFASGAGFNEWAEANHIVVLYPQAAVTVALPIEPANPMGCWDWWGYNDFAYDASGGTYARKAGVQVAAVWRMAEKLAARAAPQPAPAAPEASPALRVVDHSATQVALAWTPVRGATAYRIERSEADAAATPVATVTALRTAYVDGALRPDSLYRYRVSALGEGGEVQPSASAEARTSLAAPACDPYYSLAGDRSVTRSGRPTRQYCP